MFRFRIVSRMYQVTKSFVYICTTIYDNDKLTMYRLKYLGRNATTVKVHLKSSRCYWILNLLHPRLSNVFRMLLTKVVGSIPSGMVNFLTVYSK